MTAAAERERLACEATAKPLHEDNDFQIELIGSSDLVKTSDDKIEDYVPSAKTIIEQIPETVEEVKALTNDASLEDLMKQLKKL